MLLIILVVNVVNLKEKLLVLNSMSKPIENFEKAWLQDQLNNLHLQEEGRYELTQSDLQEIQQLLLSLQDLIIMHKY